MEGVTAMKEWLTAREIAAEALPGLPATERGVQMLADRMNWPTSMSYAREREGRGGGIEYHVALLPTEARLAYERRHRSIDLPAPASPAAPAVPAGLTDRAQRELAARLAILRAWDQYRRGSTLREMGAAEIFTSTYNAGTLKVDADVRDVVPKLSKRTLFRWKSDRAAGRLGSMAVDRSKNRKGKGVLDTAEAGAVRTFVLALIAHNPHLSAAHIRTLCRDEFGDRIAAGSKRIEMPPIRTFQAFVARLKETEHVALTKLSNPDKYRSHMAPAGVGTYRWVDGYPNALWMIDASPVDALCTDGRHSIYAAIDIATRRTMLYVSRTPRASAVGLLMRRAILAWGVPTQIKTDNGSDFVAEATKRLFRSLVIDPLLSPKYTPADKGHVERVIKTFQHDCATLLPGFVGHNVSDRKALEDRKTFATRLGEETADAFAVSMTGASLQRYVDDWVDKIYQHHSHSALAGRSPFQVAQESAEPIRTVEPAALDILLMPIAGGGGIRTATKLGIRVDGYHYVVNACLPGDRVLVRQDPNDVGRVLCFDAESGLYRGEGICPELRGISATTVLTAKREAQREIIDQTTRDARKKIKEISTGRPLIERALAVAARDVPNVVTLPKREERHETPAIAAALAASEGGKTAPHRPIDDRAARILDEIKAAPTTPANVTPLRTTETREQRFRRARELEARKAAGETIGDDNAAWLASYQLGHEYRALSAFHADFAAKT